jgi:uncharacterized protein (UPF0248 family)
MTQTHTHTHTHNSKCAIVFKHRGRWIRKAARVVVHLIQVGENKMMFRRWGAQLPMIMIVENKKKGER